MRNTGHQFTEIIFNSTFRRHFHNFVDIFKSCRHLPTFSLTDNSFVLVNFFEVVAVDELELNNFVEFDFVDFEMFLLEAALSRAHYKNPQQEIVFVFEMGMTTMKMIQAMMLYSDWLVG